MNIPANIKRLRKLKNLSQKEVAAAIKVGQGQYSVIESGKITPTIPTLEKIAKVLEVDIAELFKKPGKEDEINMSILEKVRMIDTLDKDERDCLLKMIDIAIAKKRMKDNLASMMAQ
ncbi:MAG: helix-turn-helix transcriptional regulator [Bacteroidetes bacterium]|nr:helix-turn-helix transcriptional regulator [Bacteroidota bacterium]